MMSEVKGLGEAMRKEGDGEGGRQELGAGGGYKVKRDLFFFSSFLFFSLFLSFPLLSSALLCSPLLFSVLFSSPFLSFFVKESTKQRSKQNITRNIEIKNKLTVTRVEEGHG